MTAEGYNQSVPKMPVVLRVQGFRSRPESPYTNRQCSLGC